MDIACTSMIHARAPHFRWPYAVRYAAHQLNLQPRVSRQEASPTSLWTGSPGVGLAFCAWGCLALVCDTFADKLSTRAIPCVFPCFRVDSPDYAFYHPPLHQFLDSRLPVSPPALFLAPSPPPAPTPLRGAGTRGASLGGVGGGGAGAGGASSGGAPAGGASAGGAGAGGASFGGAGAGGAGTGGASFGGAGAGVSGLRALGLPSAPLVHSQSPTTYGPSFPPPDSAPAVFSPPQSQSPPPVLPHDWTTRCPPRARPSSPFDDLRTVLFPSSPRPAPPVSVLPPPPALSLTFSSHPIIEFYHVVRPVVLHILASLGIGCDVREDRQFELKFLAATSPSLCAMLISPEGDPSALDIPTPRTYREAVSGQWASQWKAAMDLEMASWRSIGTYVDAVPPPRANVVDGMWIFKVKRLPRSPPVFKACYVARGFSQREGVDFFPDLRPDPEDDYSLGVTSHCSTARLKAALPRLLHYVSPGQPARGDLAASFSWIH
ncbi:unnamed protein product [Closterium sp. NIES-54]